VQVIDDYGHHPSEIRATLRAIKGALKKDQNEDSRIHLIFQAHRYTRTKELFSDFLTCFEDADTLILSEIYSAGETPIEGITGELLANAVQHDSVRFIPELESTLAVLAKEVAPGDIIMTMGAGSIGKFSKDALNYFQSVDL
jgi:UDP-N-acetylmuramate--alanine ligase